MLPIWEPELVVLEEFLAGTILNLYQFILAEICWNLMVWFALLLWCCSDTVPSVFLTGAGQNSLSVTVVSVIVWTERCIQADFFLQLYLLAQKFPQLLSMLCSWQIFKGTLFFSISVFIFFSKIFVVVVLTKSTFVCNRLITSQATPILGLLIEQSTTV